MFKLFVIVLEANCARADKAASSPLGFSSMDHKMADGESAVKSKGGGIRTELAVDMK